MPVTWPSFRRGAEAASVSAAEFPAENMRLVSAGFPTASAAGASMGAITAPVTVWGRGFGSPTERNASGSSEGFGVGTVSITKRGSVTVMSVPDTSEPAEE